MTTFCESPRKSLSLPVLSPEATCNQRHWPRIASVSERWCDSKDRAMKVNTIHQSCHENAHANECSTVQLCMPTSISASPFKVPLKQAYVEVVMPRFGIWATPSHGCWILQYRTDRRISTRPLPENELLTLMILSQPPYIGTPHYSSRVIPPNICPRRTSQAGALIMNRLGHDSGSLQGA
jgi:hypothetical protein